jgi:galactonate dehydratase
LHALEHHDLNNGLHECWETPTEKTARQASSIFTRKLDLIGATYPVPDEPGLRVEVDEDALQAAEPYRFYEMPHLQRRDGLVTNW